MFPEPLRVAARLAVFLLGDRGLRHERTKACVVGLVRQLDQLLLGDREIVARRPKLFAHGTEATLDLGPGHGLEHRLRPVRPLPWTLAALLMVAACGDAGDAGSCVELREPEDPASDQHVLTEGAFEYLTDPPTSGPHVAGPTPSGALQQPVARAIQVRLLEAGGVLVQHDGSIAAAALAELADETTVVAPAESLPAPVVATAWTWKLSCEDVDVERIAQFASERRGDAPGAD